MAWAGNYAVLTLARYWQTERALARRTRHLETVRSVGEEAVRELDLTRLLETIARRAAGTSPAT